MRIHTYDVAGAILSTLRVQDTAAADMQVSGDVIGWIAAADTSTTATHFVDLTGAPVLTEKPPVPPVPPTVQELKSELANISWLREVGGYLGTISEGGSDVVPAGQYWWQTDRESRSLASEKQTYLANKPDGMTIEWKMHDGTFLTMDFGGVMFMSLAMFEHVQWCSDAESDVIDQIDAASDPATLDLRELFDAAYDAAKAP